MKRNTVIALVLVGALGFAPIAMAGQKYLTASSLKKACAEYLDTLDAEIEDANTTVAAVKAAFRKDKKNINKSSAELPGAYEAEKIISEATRKRDVAEVACEVVGNAVR
jgi:hypothetical protein